MGNSQRKDEDEEFFRFLNGSDIHVSIICERLKTTVSSEIREEKNNQQAFPDCLSHSKLFSAICFVTNSKVCM